MQRSQNDPILRDMVRVYYAYCDPSTLEEKRNIPNSLVCLERNLFQRLPSETAANFLFQISDATSPERDHSATVWKFLYWLLTDEGINPGINDHEVRDAIKRCANFLALAAEKKPFEPNDRWKASCEAKKKGIEALPFDNRTTRSAFAASQAADALRHMGVSIYNHVGWAITHAAFRYGLTNGLNSFHVQPEAVLNEAYQRMADKVVELQSS